MSTASREILKELYSRINAAAAKAGLPKYSDPLPPATKRWRVRLRSDLFELYTTEANEQLHILPDGVALTISGYPVCHEYKDPGEDVSGPEFDFLPPLDRAKPRR